MFVRLLPPIRFRGMKKWRAVGDLKRGELSDRDLALARAGGLSDGEIVETVANIALNIFENYMSHVARVPVDFPQREFDGTSG